MFYHTFSVIYTKKPTKLLCYFSKTKKPNFLIFFKAHTYKRNNPHKEKHYFQ
nr:MAG TPA: hypothetical protein [Caudoviricetes sp.]